jgi:hypothetical protein
MAATNGVNDQVLRWQRELKGYRLRFPRSPKTSYVIREGRAVQRPSRLIYAEAFGLDHSLLQRK